MWFRLGFKNFIGKKNLSTDSCDIFISDFKLIWKKSLTNNEFLSISKGLNPLLEAPVQKLKDITMNLFEDVKVRKEIKEDNRNVTLKLHSTIMGVKFQFEVVLNQGDEEMLYKEFTTPLLLLLMKIQNREKKLMKIIEDKDAEIRDYKQEYGDKSNYLATQPFNEKEFDCQESEPSISWDTGSFLDCIRAKILPIDAVTTAIKQDKPFPKESEQTISVNKCDKNKLIFKNKSFNSNSGSKPCVFLDNQTVKKRRKHNDGFKIKF